MNFEENLILKEIERNNAKLEIKSKCDRDIERLRETSEEKFKKWKKNYKNLGSEKKLQEWEREYYSKD